MHHEPKLRKKHSFKKGFYLQHSIFSSSKDKVLTGVLFKSVGGGEVMDAFNLKATKINISSQFFKSLSIKSNCFFN